VQAVTPQSHLQSPAIRKLAVLIAVLIFASGAVGQLNTRCTSTKDCAPVKHDLVERKDIDKLTAAELQTFRDGVQAMLDRPKDDPLSWQYQAFIHGAIPSLNPGGRLLDGQACCMHSTWFFLSWHRMEIYYFERILRALSGNDNFAVPYWSFTDAAAAKRAIPDSFRSPTYGDKKTPNPLYYSLRRAGVNDGKPLCKEVVDASLAFSREKFWVPKGEMGVTSFGGTDEGVLKHGPGQNGHGQLESQPHDTIHVTIGLNRGEKDWQLSLTNPAGAGLDAIFWPFHVNMDRAWQCWLMKRPKDGKPVLPDARSDWATRKFKFFDAEKTELTDINGKKVPGWKAKEVCLTGQQIVDIAAQLNYKYTDCSPFPDPKSTPEWDQSIPLAEDSMSQTGVPEVVYTSVNNAVSLGPDPVTITVQIPADVQRRINALIADDTLSGSIAFEVEGIQLTPPVNTIYEVYVNLPSKPDLDWQGRYFVGILNFFAVGNTITRKTVPEEIPPAPSISRRLSGGWRPTMNGRRIV
jgi:tyrosinase